MYSIQLKCIQLKLRLPNSQRNEMKCEKKSNQGKLIEKLKLHKNASLCGTMVESCCLDV